MNNQIISDMQKPTSPKRITPQEQLWELLPAKSIPIISTVFRRLKKRDQEELCYSMIAYLRYDITRDFHCPFMQILYSSFIELVNKHQKETQK